MRTLGRRRGVLAWLLTTAAAGALYGQASQTPPLSTPAGTAPATLAATQPASGGGKALLLNFVNTPVDTALQSLAQSYGFVLVRTGSLRGQVTMTSRGAVTATEALKLLNDVLAPQGYAALVMHASPPNDLLIVRVVSLREALLQRVPVYTGADPTKIAQTDQVITQIIPLRSVDAVRLRNDLGPMLSQDAEITANAGSNSLIVTDTSVRIHTLAEVVSALDRDQAFPNALANRTLKYATAADVARLINDIFNPQNNAVPADTSGGGAGPGGRGGGGRGGGGRGGRGGGRGGAAAPPPGSDDLAALGKVFASSDARTNTLVLVGPPAAVKAAMDLVIQIDADPVNDVAYFVYNLKNVSATDLAPVLNATFGSGSTTTVGGVLNAGATGGRGGGATGGRGGGGTGGRGGGFSAGGLGGGALGSAGRGSGASGGTANMIGQVYVVANLATNSLLIQTTRELKDPVKAMLESLDRPVPQVMINTLIAMITHGNSDDIGVEFSFKPPGVSGVPIVTDFGVQQATGGLKIGVTQTMITANLHALANQNKLDVLAHPYILTQDNQEAILQIGQEVPYITNSQVTTDGSTINSVSYANIGVILDVIPHINPNGQVTLDIAPQVSQLDTGSGVPISSTVNAPVFDTRSLQARVAVRNGETVVIGGLMMDKNTEVVQKIPILGDIPLAGMLFRRSQTQKSKVEMVIFLTPHVAMDSSALRPMTEDTRGNLKLVPNSVQPGEFRDQLKGMEQGAIPTAAQTRPAVEILVPGGN